MTSITELKLMALREAELYDVTGFISISPYKGNEAEPHVAGVHLTYKLFTELSEGKEMKTYQYKDGYNTEYYFVEDGVLFFALKEA